MSKLGFGCLPDKGFDVGAEPSLSLNPLALVCLSCRFLSNSGDMNPSGDTCMAASADICDSV